MDRKEIVKNIVIKFQYLYSSNYKNHGHLYSIANPERKEKLKQDTSFTFEPEFKNPDRLNKLDTLNQSKVHSQYDELVSKTKSDPRIDKKYLLKSEDDYPQSELTNE